MQPLISIIIPTYNRPNFTSETLDSVVIQTYSNWECIVVDDGSTGGIPNSIYEYTCRDSRITVLSRSLSYPSGGNGARNMGLDKAVGEWVIFLDSDDLLTKDCLQSRVSQILQNPAADMVLFYTGLFYESIGDCDRVWNALQKNEKNLLDIIYRFIDQDLPWHTTSVLWKKKFLKTIGGWDQEVKAWQDWELHLRALTYEPKLSFSNNPPDNYYRQDVANSIVSKKNTSEYYSAVAQAIKTFEPYVLGLKDERLAEKFKYLLIRFFINRPLALKNKKLSFFILAQNIRFKFLSKKQIVYYYLIEFLSRKKGVKRILRRLWFERYYRKVQARTTHLAAKYQGE